ncbi:MAG: methionyl-tRNA formyltransferase [Woeseiaceae bacterium]
MNEQRIVFAGTPAFGLASLQAMVEAGIRPVAVLTQPDRPAGRGKKLTASPVKQYAVEHGIEVLQPASLRHEDAARQLADLQPDLLVVAAYGLILPQQIIDIPTHGCLNVHASLLPRWRGAAPIQAAILAGDDDTGISLMSMDAGLDTGAVYVREAVQIGAEETAGELHDRLAWLGGHALVSYLPEILSGKMQAEAQDDAHSSYAHKIDKAAANLDWQLPALQLARVVRAYNPVPGSRFHCDNLLIKCWEADAIAGTDAPPGTVIGSSRDGVIVACGEGALRMKVLQRPGKKRVNAQQFSEQLDLTGRCLL